MKKLAEIGGWPWKVMVSLNSTRLLASRQPSRVEEIIREPFIIKIVMKRPTLSSTFSTPSRNSERWGGASNAPTLKHAHFKELMRTATPSRGSARSTKSRKTPIPAHQAASTYNFSRTTS